MNQLHLHPETEKTRFSYKQVEGTFIPNEDNSICIYTFVSHNPRKGEAKECLQKLKEEFPQIAVTDIGEFGDPSHQFWLYMVAKDLIQFAYDPQGKEWTKKSLLEECPYCNGAGFLDSGGVTPWMQPITQPCPINCKS